jgi:NitT/TauT family transport system permease protein
MKQLQNISKKVLTILFWIFIWFVISIIIDNELLLPDPFEVLVKLFELFCTPKFWLNTFSSLYRVVIGIIIAIFLGVGLGYLSYKFNFIYEILYPLMTVLRATPVASFIILIALFIGAITVPSIITIIMVLPIVWMSVYTGLNDIDKDLKEVCITYKLSLKQRLKALYVPALLPYFTSAVLSSIGLGWKAGIAAEILFPPLKSIGKSIAESNQLLLTTDLFAWTLVVIILSVLFEILTKSIIKLTAKKSGGLNENKKP